MHSNLVDGVGLWLEVSQAPSAPICALFLDRDGVIVEDVHYLAKVADIKLLAGAPQAIAEINALGVPVVVVTNQSGIGRGYYDWQTFHEIHLAIAWQLAEAGARIDAVLACAYHEDARPPFNVADHVWRKPNPGMIHMAEATMQCDLARSVIVGDRYSDIESGKRAGLGRGILLQSGSQPSGMPARKSDDIEVTTAPDLAAAVRLLRAEGWPSQWVKCREAL